MGLNRSQNNWVPHEEITCREYATGVAEGGVSPGANILDLSATVHDVNWDKQ